MTFLNPLVLLGLVAAAIPLIIHLFNFRRPKRIEFSSLVFLREVQRSTMQRVRIKQWLLLLLRTLAIAFLVIAFARPTIRGGLAELFGTDAPGAIAIVIDDSPSMSIRDADGAYLDQARLAGRAIAGSTDMRDEVYVFTTGSTNGLTNGLTNGSTNGSSAGFTAGNPELAGAAPGGETAASRVSEVEQSAASGSLESAVRRAKRALEDSPQVNREIYVVSDVQASMVSDSVETTTQAGDISLRLVKVGERDVANVSIADVRVVSRIVEAGQPVRIEARLVNHGTASIAGYLAALEIAGRRVAQTSVDLPPGLVVTVEFVANLVDRGWSSGRVEIEDDAFPADNVRHFTLLVPEKRRILFVVGDGADEGYVRTALSESLTRDRLGFEVTTIEERSLGSSRLSDFDVMLLHGPVDLASGEVDRIARFVADGGGLLWFPSAEARLEDYRALLAAIGGGTVRGFSIGRDPEAPLDVVDRFELEHPLFDGLLDRSGTSIEEPRVFRRLDYRPGPGQEQTLIRLASQAPFLVEIRSGKGVVLLMTSAPEPGWTDLPTRGLFLPLLYRSIFLLSSTGTVEGERLLVGSSDEIVLTRAAESDPIEIIGPAGESVAPPRRAMSGGVLVSLDGLLGEPGTYSVRSGDRELHRFAVNIDAREGNLASMDPDQAAALLGRLTGTLAGVLALEASDPDAARTAMIAQRSGVEWWNVFLLLALLILTAEMAVAALWRPEAST